MSARRAARPARGAPEKTVTLRAERIACGGVCVARLEGKAALVSGALPGETVEAALTGEKRDYVKARVTRVLEASPHRRIPRCPVWGACGGCDFQIAGYEYQLELKRTILSELCRRAGVSAPPIGVAGGAEWEYRSRLQVHAAKGADGAPAPAFMAREGGRAAVAEDCPAAVPPLRRFLSSGRLRSLLSRAERLQLCACFRNGEETVVAAGEGAPERDVYQRALGKNIYFAPEAFFQSNVPMLEVLIGGIRASFSLDAAPGNSAGTGGTRLLDAYGGCGVLGAFLADGFGEVFVMDADPRALALAARNFPPDAPPRLFCVPCREWARMEAARLPFDAVIADPPRGGLEPAFLAWLCSAKPPEFRYVSCAPAALARDAARLTGAGFQLRAVTIYDFYPQTSHIEALAVFGA